MNQNEDNGHYQENHDQQPENNQETYAQQETVEELQRCLANSQEWQNKFLRATADYENLTRRVQKERAQWMTTAQTEVLSNVLALVDDFDRALNQPKPDDARLDAWLAGFSLIAQSLQKLLKKFEVTEIIDFSVFNPELHEAVMQVESAEHTSGDIVQVLQKGYLLKGSVLRPAKVSVAQ